MAMAWAGFGVPGIRGRPENAATMTRGSRRREDNLRGIVVKLLQKAGMFYHDKMPASRTANRPTTPISKKWLGRRINALHRAARAKKKAYGHSSARVEALSLQAISRDNQDGATLSSIYQRR